jgi:hypothetical protein
MPTPSRSRCVSGQRRLNVTAKLAEALFNLFRNYDIFRVALGAFHVWIFIIDGDAPLLAKDKSTLDPASRRRHMDTAGGEEGQLNRAARWEGVFPLKLLSGPLRAPV